MSKFTLLLAMVGFEVLNSSALYAAGCLRLFNKSGHIDIDHGVKMTSPDISGHSSEGSVSGEFSSTAFLVLKSLSRHFSWLSDRQNLDLFREEAALIGPVVESFSEFLNLKRRRRELIEEIKNLQNYSYILYHEQIGLNKKIINEEINLECAPCAGQFLRT